MRIALDPYMLRSTPLLALPRLVAALGYRYIELSPREDFIPFFRHPRVDRATIRAFKEALASYVRLAASRVAAMRLRSTWTHRCDREDDR